MKKRFILLLNSSSPQQNEAFLAAIRAHQIVWWHWFPNAWLIVNPPGNLTAEELRDMANTCFPGVHKVVLESRANGTETWAGFGPTNTNMFEWIRENWKQL